MQSEDPRMHIMLPRLSFLFRQIARNFIKKNILDEFDILNIDLNKNHVPLEDIFCGTQIDVYILSYKIDNTTVLDFKQCAIKFYQKFCEVLRAKVNFGSEMLLWFPKFTPENVINGKTSSIVPFLIKMFPNEDKHFSSINNQYRALADLTELKEFSNYNICDFWFKISKIKNELNELMFPDILRVAVGILSIPHSSANVERVFSYQNIIKTKERNRLNVSTLPNIIQTKDLLKSTNSSCFNLKMINELLKV